MSDTKTRSKQFFIYTSYISVESNMATFYPEYNNIKTMKYDRWCRDKLVSWMQSGVSINK